MPATVSFIQISPHACIPVKVFVHRKQMWLRGQLNDKSLLKLSSVSLIRLSNPDMTKLVEDIKDELKQLLLHELLRRLFPGKPILKSSQVKKILGRLWKCRVVVSLGYLADLRFKLHTLVQADDVSFLDEKNILVSATDSNELALLTKEIMFSFQEPDEDGVNEGLDKKTISYKLDRIAVMNSRATDTLSVFVLHRPRNE